MSLFIHIAALFSYAESFHMRGQATAHIRKGVRELTNEAYTFHDFVRVFGRPYAAGSAEYVRRAAVFDDSMLQITALNSRANRSWTAGPHPFMDWTSAERSERLHGYEPARSRRQMPLLQKSAETLSNRQRYGGTRDSFEAETPPVRNQGGFCGSCWATAAVEAVEAQLMKSESPLSRQRLSVQALVDCVPNPKHCGGQGGCRGATPELAFDFMQNMGVPLEMNLPYQQEDGKCPINPFPSDWARVTLAGWRQLPSNQAQPFMRALVEDGPVVVAVDAHNWYHFHAGIFDGCQKDAIPNHSVLAKGYGVASSVEDSQGRSTSPAKYWLLQNSWGSEWGESGFIRLLRHDDEDGWCGTDRRPQEGNACEDEGHREVTVCGSCGILFDGVIPEVSSITLPHDPGAAHDAMEREAIFEETVGIPGLNEHNEGQPLSQFSGDGFHTHVVASSTPASRQTHVATPNVWPRAQDAGHEEVDHSDLEAQRLSAVSAINALTKSADETTPFSASSVGPVDAFAADQQLLSDQL